jgi:hypothetical protein
MGKYLGTITLILLLTSCVSEDIIPNEPQFIRLEKTNNITSSSESTKKIEYELELDGRLPIDKNGYYHLVLNKSSHQTIHRVSGKVKGNTHPLKIEWNSNLFWWLLQGQVVANITKTYFNPFTGELVYVNLPPLMNWRNVLVPTINTASYSGNSGELNTIIAPVKEMKGDTLVVNARIIETQIKKQIKIVLE